MITRFTVLVAEDDPVAFGTDTAPVLQEGMQIGFEEIPIMHTSRKRHLTLGGNFRVVATSLLFERKNGLIQTAQLEPVDEQLMEWTANS